MTNLQFNSQEEFERYIANRNQWVENSHRNKTAFWKMAPMVLGVIAVGFAMMWVFPSPDIKSGKERGSQNRTEQRVEAFLGLFGVDIEEHRREREQYMERIRNSRAEIKETPIWSGFEVNHLPH